MEREREPAVVIDEHAVGHDLSIRSIQMIVKALGEAAGIARPIAPHILRHAFATEFVELGTPMPVVHEALGHAEITTTQGYVHPRSAGRRQALDALGARVMAARLSRAA